jgi:hypothetical protein
MPGGQSIVSHVDSEGNPTEVNKIFSTAGGLYGFSMNPVQPHTTNSESRTCGSCHSSPKALGLGTEGLVDLKRHGLPIHFPPDKIVDEEGVKIQDSPHEGARPFSGEELRSVYRTGSCESCHDEPVERVDRPDAPPTLKGADELHRRLIELLVAPKEE